MGIKGFQGTSLLDYPGRIASLVFWGGCNLTCPFCHNPALVLEPESLPDLDHDELLADLEQRRSFIDGVVVSGGEPTIDPGLTDFLRRVKGLDLSVKLDTNGLAPQMIAQLLEEALVDHLAIDLKASPARYAELHPARVEPERLNETIRLALSSHAQLEFRTTCIPRWVDQDVIRELGALVKGAPLWALQQYHPEYALDEALRQETAYSASQVEQLADVAGEYVAEVVVRGL